MAIKSATPYLVFGGKAEEAIAFYSGALGAKVQTLQRFGDMQPDCPAAIKNWVAHAVIQFDSGATLMLSDGSPEDKPTPGSSTHVALDIDSAAQGKAAFDALSKGGTVSQPLIEAPWGAQFGALQDRYGIRWMFNVAKG
ncbi:glyoxalase/bleomycin resistance protein/dioxygenase [Myxococcus stipitatus DSM 14675]|uniref:Glyoxalase/bleomycin resistance protein/dioxygenase n=1 Tax=Myxococcus stipitatus (strain DSM 14675 / JCM 12634 / Mx s8) TaxID=1278073 RepID=L7U3J4_MYXSD|nr:VOC family protein [Myxococcus stipitatus]AGC43346.1 glyoxalase/bleomycin resistance protein/dioxygenase [Myxococcus stipitatus DSM 14675]